jgi:hypothetical protein
MFLAMPATPQCQPQYLISLLRPLRVVFLGYSDHHKGYHCLDLSTNRLVISQPVVSDDAVFPFTASPHPTDDLDFLLSEETHMVPPIDTRLPVGPTAPCAAMLKLLPSSPE